MRGLEHRGDLLAQVAGKLACRAADTGLCSPSLPFSLCDRASQTGVPRVQGMQTVLIARHHRKILGTGPAWVVCLSLWPAEKQRGCRKTGALASTLPRRSHTSARLH